MIQGNFSVPTSETLYFAGGTKSVLRGLILIAFPPSQVTTPPSALRSGGGTETINPSNPLESRYTCPIQSQRKNVVGSGGGGRANNARRDEGGAEAHVPLVRRAKGKKGGSSQLAILGWMDRQFASERSWSSRQLIISSFSVKLSRGSRDGF